MRIRHKLTIGYAIAALLIALVGYLTALVGQSTLTNHIAQLSEDIADHLATEVDLRIRSRMEEFQAYSRTTLLRRELADSNDKYATMSDREAHIQEQNDEWTSVPREKVTPFMQDHIQNDLSDEFRDILNFYSEKHGYRVFGEMFVTNRYGVNVAESHKTWDFLQSDEDWWQMAWEKGLYVSDVEFDRSSNVYSVDLAVRVEDSEGKALGVLNVALNIAELFDVIVSAYASDVVRERKPTAYSILTSDGKLLYSTRPFKRFEKAPELLPDDPMAARMGTFTRENEEGEQLVCAYARAPEDGAQNSLGWLVVTEHNRDRIFAPVEEFRNTTYGISLAVLVCGFLFGTVVSRSISKRLERLRSDARIIGEGNLDHRVEPTREDEIGELCREFDQMAQNLKRITASRDELNREIKERERAQKKLRDTLEELKRSNAELEQFAYVASHDLQEPLRKVRAFGARLESKCKEELTEKGKDYLERMLNAAKRMSDLINDLLMLSRVTTKAKPFQPLDLKEVAEEVRSDLETRIEDVAGRVEIDDLPTIDADSTQMRQIFQNLIGNALKFHREDEPPVVCVESALHEQNGEEMCELRISDNGIGFKEKYLDRIFTVFQRLHARDEFPGTGMGLALCRKIVERHNGQITAESKPGEGSTFIITLPVHHTDEEGENDEQTDNDPDG